MVFSFFDMFQSPKFVGLSVVVAVCLSGFAGPPALQAQRNTHDRIVRKADTRSSFRVNGNIHPLARPDNDRGKVGESFRMERVSVIFKATEAQNAALEALLEQQQNPASPDYHKWLRPEDFGDRFGLSSNDIDQIVSWLRDQGFTVDEIGKARRWVTFSGSAQQVETAFQTSIHQYAIDGDVFYANIADPAIPSAFSDVILGFRALNNFRLKPRPRFTSNMTGNHI